MLYLPKIPEFPWKKGPKPCTCRKLFFFLNLYHFKFKSLFTIYFYHHLYIFLDIDECSLEIHTCTKDQECKNSPGRYECLMICSSGFFRSENGSCAGKNLIIS